MAVSAKQNEVWSSVIKLLKSSDLNLKKHSVNTVSVLLESILDNRSKICENIDIHIPFYRSLILLTCNFITKYNRPRSEKEFIVTIDVSNVLIEAILSRISISSNTEFASYFRALRCLVFGITSNGEYVVQGKQELKELTAALHASDTASIFPLRKRSVEQTPDFRDLMIKTSFSNPLFVLGDNDSRADIELENSNKLLVLKYNRKSLIDLGGFDILILRFLSSSTLVSYVPDLSQKISDTVKQMPLTIAEAMYLKKNFVDASKDLNRIECVLALASDEFLTKQRLLSLFSLILGSLQMTCEHIMSRIILQETDTDCEKQLMKLVDQFISNYHVLITILRNSNRCGGQCVLNLHQLSATVLASGLYTIMTYLMEYKKDGSSSPKQQRISNIAKKYISSKGSSLFSGPLTSMCDHLIVLLIFLLDDLRITSGVDDDFVSERSLLTKEQSADIRINDVLLNVPITSTVVSMIYLSFKKYISLKRFKKSACEDSDSVDDNEEYLFDESSFDEAEDEPMIGKWMAQIFDVNEENKSKERGLASKETHECHIKVHDCEPFLSVAVKGLNFLTNSFLNSGNSKILAYISSSINEDCIEIFAALISDIDKMQVGEEFSSHLTKSIHFLLSSNILLPKTQCKLLEYLNLSPDCESPWPSVISHKSLGILAHVLCNLSVVEEDNRSCVKVWTKFIQTLEKLIITETSVEVLSLEHAQLLVVIFYSFSTDTKRMLLDSMLSIFLSIKEPASSLPLARLVLLIDHLLSEFDTVSPALMCQVRANLFRKSQPSAKPNKYYFTLVTPLTVSSNSLSHKCRESTALALIPEYENFYSICIESFTNCLSKLDSSNFDSVNDDDYYCCKVMWNFLSTFPLSRYLSNSMIDCSFENLNSTQLLCVLFWTPLVNSFSDVLGQYLGVDLVSELLTVGNSLSFNVQLVSAIVNRQLDSLKNYTPSSSWLLPTLYVHLAIGYLHTAIYFKYSKKTFDSSVLSGMTSLLLLLLEYLSNISRFAIVVHYESQYKFICTELLKISSSHGARITNISVNFTDNFPIVLKESLKDWNSFVNFTHDKDSPMESYVDSILHASWCCENPKVILKSCITIIMDLIGDMLNVCPSQSDDFLLQTAFYNVILDAATEPLIECVNAKLRDDLHLNKMMEQEQCQSHLFTMYVTTCYNIILNPLVDHSMMDDTDVDVLLNCINCLGLLLDKQLGRLAFFNSGVSTVNLLLLGSSDYVSHRCVPKILELVIKILGVSESSYELLKEIVSVDHTVVGKWAIKLLCKDNVGLFQKFIDIIICHETLQPVCEFLMKALTVLVTDMLVSKSNIECFPDLLDILILLASGGHCHIDLVRYVVDWMRLADDNFEVLSSMMTFISSIGEILGGLKDGTIDFDSASLIESELVEEDGDDDDDDVEDSDDESICNKLCTFTTTQRDFINQHWYHCHTCNMNDGVGVCTICAKVCHKDHDVTYAKYGSFFCDCGAKEDGSCSTMVKRSPCIESVAKNSFVDFPKELPRRKSFSTGMISKPEQTEDSPLKFALLNQPDTVKENIKCFLRSDDVRKVLLYVSEVTMPIVDKHFEEQSITWCRKEVDEISDKLLSAEKHTLTQDAIMTPTLGSQEGAFENMKMVYTGDQGQTIRQLMNAHIIRRVAMCILSASGGKRQHLAVAHEKGKVTLLQLSSLLKQSEASKKKTMLTRLTSAPVPFTIISIFSNPCNDEALAVCGLKDCHILTFSSTGTVLEHIPLPVNLESGNYIIKAIWLPGSQTEIAILTADFLKIYDLSKDSNDPFYYFFLPSGKMRDVTFMLKEKTRTVMIMSSNGMMYAQLMDEDSSVVNGTFYFITIVVDVVHPEIKQQSSGQIGGGGVSIYYSHVLDLLFFSYAHGKNFCAPVQTSGNLISKIFQIQYKPSNGSNKSSNAALAYWSEVVGHPGIIYAVSHASGTPVVMMVNPESILLQEMKSALSKSKTQDVVVLRHNNGLNGQVSRTTMILLCEDGSLKLYQAKEDITKFWLSSIFNPDDSGLAASFVRQKKCKIVKSMRRLSRPILPVDFFENCQHTTDIEFGGNDLLQIYSTQQLKQRLDNTGLGHIASTKQISFVLEVTNTNSNNVLVGCRILLCESGGAEKAPQFVQIFGRTININPMRSRWYDIPFMREEVVDKKLCITFGQSGDPSGVTSIDCVKLYSRTKDQFGWLDDCNDDISLHNVSCHKQQLSTIDYFVCNLLQSMEISFQYAQNKTDCIQYATKLLMYTNHGLIQQHAQSTLAALQPSKIAYHLHNDMVLISSIFDTLANNSEPLIYQRLLVTLRNIAVFRPMNFSKLITDHAKLEGVVGVINWLMYVFWVMWNSKVEYPSLVQVFGKWFFNIDVVISALVDIIFAFLCSEVEGSVVAVGHLVKILLSEDKDVGFAGKNALYRALRPHAHTKMDKSHGDVAPMHKDPSNIPIAATAQRYSGYPVSEPVPMNHLESLLGNEIINIAPDVDDEAMVELAIALSLQDTGQHNPTIPLLQPPVVFSDDDEIASVAEKNVCRLIPQNISPGSESGDIDSMEHSARSSTFGELDEDSDSSISQKSIRILLLQELLDGLSANVSGTQIIPYMQVILLLASELSDKSMIETTVKKLGCQLTLSIDDVELVIERTPVNEVQLVIMRMMSVFMHDTTKSDPYLGRTIARALLDKGVLKFCLKVLQVLSKYWWKQNKQDQAVNTLLKPRICGSLPDMSPFFLKQYVRNHTRDVFEQYINLLTEMVLQMPYQIKKLVEGIVFDDEWSSILGEYMLMNGCASYIRRRVRKLHLSICGTKACYRYLRDVYFFEYVMDSARKIFGGAGLDECTLELPYDMLVELVEKFEACSDMAHLRTGNWQKYCKNNEETLCFLLRISFCKDDNLCPIIFRLLSAGLCGYQKESSKDSQVEDDLCLSLVQQVITRSDSALWYKFIAQFLLDSNIAAIRWQAHSLIYHIYKNSTQDQQEMLIDILWDLWSNVAVYGKNICQFIDLMGYFTIKTFLPPEKLKKFIESAVAVLKSQNKVVMNHDNTNLYQQLSNYLNVDGYYLEADPCLVCNNPELQYQNIKLTSIRADSRHTTTTHVMKLVATHTISKINLHISDIKRAKMVKVLVIHYNNRTDQSVVELKNKPQAWSKATKVTLQLGQVDVKMDFIIPIVASNLMIEYQDFYDNVQASTETLNCPRCSSTVPANPGVCSNCGENVFQCHKCRAINYDERDPFLCNACGFCKYGKFDYMLSARQCSAVDVVQNEEDRDKTINTINLLLEKADNLHKERANQRPQLECLVSHINDGYDKELVVSSKETGVPSVSNVNNNIQLMANKYCVECKNTFEDLSKIAQKVISCRKEIISYDEKHLSVSASSLSGVATDGFKQSCYGCSSAVIEYCLTLLKAVASSALLRTYISPSLLAELVTCNIRIGTADSKKDARYLIALLCRDNPAAHHELNELIFNRIYNVTHIMKTSSDFGSVIKYEFQILTTMLEQIEDNYGWENRVCVIINMVEKALRDHGPILVDCIVLPCLRIISTLVKPVQHLSKKNKDKTPVQIVNCTLKRPLFNFPLESSNKMSKFTVHSWKTQLSKNKFTKKEARRICLQEKYGNRWMQNVLQKEKQTSITSPWLLNVLFCKSSKVVRQVSCSMVESLCSTNMRHELVLDMLTAYLPSIGESGESATQFLSLYRKLAKYSSCQSYLIVKGVLPIIGDLIHKEIKRLSFMEENYLPSNLSQGYALKMLSELLGSFVEVDCIRVICKRTLLGTILDGYLLLKRLIIQRTKPIDESQDMLLEMLENMTSGTEQETHQFMLICIDAVNRCPDNDMTTPLFIFERLCNIIFPEEDQVSEFFITVEKDPQQDDFLQGRMQGNPYSSNDPGMGPLMRNIKTKICRDTDLVALLDDDNGMELLVCNKIISLDLPVREVYRKLWIIENENDAIRIVYRMRGLLGDATEEFIDHFECCSDEDLDSEDIFKLAAVMSDIGGLDIILHRLHIVNDLARGKQLIMILLKLLGYCVKVKINRQSLIVPNSSTIEILLDLLNLALDYGGVAGMTIAEKILALLGVIMQEEHLVESLRKYGPENIVSGEIRHLRNLINKLDSLSVRECAPVLQGILFVLPFMALGTDEKMKTILDRYIPYDKFEELDMKTLEDGVFHLNCLCIIADSIPTNYLGRQLKEFILESLTLVPSAVDYICNLTPATTYISDPDAWKEFLGRPALPFVLRMLKGLCKGHNQTAITVAQSCIPSLHRIERVSSSERVGTLAENLLEVLREHSQVVSKVDDVREQTKQDKKKQAMLGRKRQLVALGMKMSSEGRVISAKTKVEIDELEHETGLTCCICREGYRYQPTKVLGIYTFSKRVILDYYENKPRKTAGYSTFSHFNVIHFDCHVSAVRTLRTRDEWESAALQNTNTKCNGLLPLWGPQIVESAFVNCLARHNNYLQDATGYREPTYQTSLHDVKLLLLTFAFNRSFSNETGGGGRESNAKLLPYLVHVVLYVLNTTRSVSREVRQVESFLSKDSNTWVESAYDLEGPLYHALMAVLVFPPDRWASHKIYIIKRLIAIATAHDDSAQCETALKNTSPRSFEFYRPYLVYFGILDLMVRMFAPAKELMQFSQWSQKLAEYIRNNDVLLMQFIEDIFLPCYENDLLASESFEKLCGSLCLLGEISHPDAFIKSVVDSLPANNG